MENKQKVGENTRVVSFVVGNTHTLLPESIAVRAASAPLLKVHDWELYVDILSGSPDAIHAVSFDLGSTFSPSIFRSFAPIPINVGGKRLWRFQTRQQTYAATTAVITILGSTGSRKRLHYNIICRKGGAQMHPKEFVDTGKPLQFKFSKLPEDRRFRLDFVFTSTFRKDQLDRALKAQLSGMHTAVTQNKSRHRSSHTDIHKWKILQIFSTRSDHDPSGESRFQILSPYIEGEAGILELSRVTDFLTMLFNLAGGGTGNFHVCVDVSSMSLRELIKICQNFVKYEDVFDSLLEKVGSPCDRVEGYPYHSNKRALGCNSNRERHDVLSACESIEALVHAMNPSRRTDYKLNLQKLLSNGVLEFCQHPLVVNNLSMEHWVRMCVAFVQKSASLAEPTPFKAGRGLGFSFDALFFYVIKDRALRDVYREANSLSS